MPEPTPDPLLRVLRGLVRPLVRTLISRGVTAPAFYRLLKQVYVEVAHEEFRIDDAPPTDSRITLLTGVHRRDVRAILEAEDRREESRLSPCLFPRFVIGLEDRSNIAPVNARQQRDATVGRG
ncbi:MAG: DUF6502 family protein, partial [Pseudomonadota bacterium]